MKLSFLIDRLIHRIWSKEHMLLLIRPTGKVIDEKKLKHCSGYFMQVTDSNIKDCTNFEDEKYYVPIYKEMINRGDQVFYGYSNKKCVFRYCIQMSGSIELDGCNVHNLGRNECYIHYVFCDPNYRGLGFHVEGVNHACKIHNDYTIYTLVKPDNKSSLRGFFHNGFEIDSLINVNNRFLYRILYKTIISDEEKIKLMQ